MDSGGPGLRSAEAIAAATHLKSLRQLVIGGNISDAGAKAIAGAAHLGTLKLLSLRGVGQEGAAALRASPYLKVCVIHTRHAPEQSGESYFAPEVPLD